MGIELKEYHYVPPGFLDCTSKNLYQIVPQPSLIYLTGKKSQPLFISILQHGNEAVGLYAVQRLLKVYSEDPLPRSLVIFVSNIEAAKKSVRRLDYQPDYNRMWPVEDESSQLPEAKIMQQVTEKMRELKPFASIDLHSNTGLNPHYACINRLDNQFFHLASLFSKLVVYFIRPQGVQSIAFADICPSVTLECGHVDDESGITHAFEFIDACVQLHEIPETPIEKSEIEIYHTVATVKVPASFKFSFEDSTQDIYFNPDIEAYNFKEVEQGSLFALTHPDKTVNLNVYNEDGINVVDDYFRFHNNEIRLTKTLMPSMITLDQEIIRQDCLCYLMERIDLHNRKNKRDSVTDS